MSYVDLITRVEVRDAETFGKFAAQTLGVPLYRRDLNVLKGAAREFFELNPGSNWQTLAKTAEWVKGRYNVRSLISIVNSVKHAAADGQLPELDRRRDANLEADIDAALRVESDATWRHRLICSYGPGRLEVYRDWCRDREPLLNRKVPA